MAEHLFFPDSVHEAVRQYSQHIHRTGSKVPIHIHGESGTGKSTLARQIHSRFFSEGSFISLECQGVPEELLLVTLLGHTKGAFTGAIDEKAGLIQLANNGILVLEDVSFLKLEAQRQLIGVLNKLHAGRYSAIGASEDTCAQVQLVSTSKQTLEDDVNNGSIIDDLFYRLHGLDIALPSIRHMSKSEVLSSVQCVAKNLALEFGYKRIHISNECLILLSSHAWPGNFRELKNSLTRSILIGHENDSENETISIEKVYINDDLSSHGEVKNASSCLVALPPITISMLRNDSTLKDITDHVISMVEERVITTVLLRTNWKKARAAELLGISRPTLDTKIEKYKIRKDYV